MKRSNQLLVTAIPVLLLGVQVGGVGAQEPSNSIAVALVSEALHTLGADSTVSVIRTMRLTGNGARSWFGQGSSPLNPTLVMPWNVEWIVDFENQRSFRRQVTFRGPDAYFCIWTTYRPDAVFSFECITRILFPADPQSLQQRHATAMTIHPQPRAVLAEALRESETLRYEGVRNVGSDARLHIVSFANAQQRRRTLYIDAGTKLLTRVEDERVQLPLGSVIPLEEYGDYRRVHDIWVPFLFRRVRPLQNSVGMVITDEEQYIEVEFNAAADEAVFAVPEPHFPRRPDSEVTITEVAEGVYFIENATPNYNQLAVEFSEYLLVVDAPSNTEVSRTVIDQLARRVPNKPIRYVVTSHFHHDHIGGIAAYVEQGAQIVTTRGNVPFVRQLIQIADSIPSPDPVIEMGRTREFFDPGQRLEFYDVGPNPHSDELLIAYLPEHDILYVTDVFSADWGQVRPAIGETFALADELFRLQLDVEIILPSHGPQATWQDFQRSLQGGGPVLQRR